MATVKLEKVHLNDYENDKQARANTTKFIEGVYDTRRSQLSLEHLPPKELGAACARGHTG